MANKNKGGELEYLRGLVRQQKSIISDLKKQVSRNNKRKHAYEDLEQKLVESQLEKEQAKLDRLKSSLIERCPDCRQSLKSTEIGNRKLLICDNCDYRKTKKNG